MTGPLKVDIAHLLEDQITGLLADHFAYDDQHIWVAGRTFETASAEVVPDDYEDAIVLIEPATGDLFEVEIYGVSVRKIQIAPPDVEPVDPNQLSLLPNLDPEGAA